MYLSSSKGSTVLVESHHTPTDAPSTSPPHISPTLRSPIRQETEFRQLSSPPHTNVADEVASTCVDVRHEGAATTVTSLDAGQGSGNINKTPSMPYDSPLLKGHTLGSDEGRMQQHELMDLVIKLSDRCEALETDLRQTKKVYGDAFTRLIKKVKKLEKTVKTSQARRRSRVVISDNEEDLEDSSKQGRMIEEIDQDTGITLVQINAEDQVTPTKVSAQGEAHTQQDQPEDHLRVLSAAKVLVDATSKRREVENVQSYTRRRRAVSTGSGEISTAEEPVSTAGASMPVSTVGMVQEASTPSSVATKDKAERQRIARVHEEASPFNIEEWEDIQATIEADEELAQRIQVEEREKYSKAGKARLVAELINQRKKYFAQQRAEERRNKPLTQAQQRTYMSNYIKHIGSHTQQQLRRLSFDELKALFETTMRRVQTFHPIESEGDKTVPELTTGSSKRVVEVELDHEGSKKQKTNEASGPVQEQPEEEETKFSQEDLQQTMMVALVEEVYVEALQKFDKDDLDKLWSLVKEIFSSTGHTDDKERTLWVKLKKLFEPDIDDILWKLQRCIHDPLT
ncbi:hypothetical protein Tco_0378638 [Tanacetum coccineum]